MPRCILIDIEKKTQEAIESNSIIEHYNWLKDRVKELEKLVNTFEKKNTTVLSGRRIRVRLARIRSYCFDFRSIVQEVVIHRKAFRKLNKANQRIGDVKISSTKKLQKPQEYKTGISQGT